MKLVYDLKVDVKQVINEVSIANEFNHKHALYTDSLFTIHPHNGVKAKLPRLSGLHGKVFLYHIRAVEHVTAYSSILINGIFQ